MQLTYRITSFLQNSDKQIDTQVQMLPMNMLKQVSCKFLKGFHTIESGVVRSASSQHDNITFTTHIPH